MVPDKVMVWQHEDGRVFITTPGPGFPLQLGETEEAYFLRLEAHLRAKDGRDGVPGEASTFSRATVIRVCPRAEVPGENDPKRQFRAAWRPDFSVDMVKAREIHEATCQARGELTDQDKARIAGAGSVEELLEIKVI